MVDAVEKEKSRVKLGHKLKAFCFAPGVDGRIKGCGFREWLEVIGRAGQFQNPVRNPFFKSLAAVPGTTLGVMIGGKQRELVDDKEIESYSADFLPRDVIENQ